MDQEEKDLLRRNLALNEENNDILRSLQRSMRFSRFMTIIYWLFIIGSFVGAYYLVQPYLDQATSLYNSAQSKLKQTSDVTVQAGGILENLKQKLGQ